MKKTVLLLVAAFSFLTLSAQSQEINNIHTAPQPRSVGVIYKEKQPYCAIVTKDKVTAIMKTQVEKLNADWFERVDVYKGQQALELFGEKAKDGAAIITIKEDKEEEVLRLLIGKQE